MSSSEQLGVEQPPLDMKSQLAEMGILFDLEKILRDRIEVDEEFLPQMTCYPEWQAIEVDPGSVRDISELLGEGYDIPELVFECRYPDYDGNIKEVAINVLDVDLKLSNEQILALDEIASQRATKVFKY